MTSYAACVKRVKWQTHSNSKSNVKIDIWEMLLTNLIEEQEILDFFDLYYTKEFM